MEYPINLDNLLPGDVEVKAVCIEAQNMAMQTTAPEVALSGGVRTELDCRLLNFRSNFVPGTAYVLGDQVIYNNLYWMCNAGNVGAVPGVDPKWAQVDKGRMYLRLPEDLSLDWAIQPQVGWAVYGFIEISVKETSGSFRRTWKPVRGMIEYLFSPTL